jgi:hypothetical protein
MQVYIVNMLCPDDADTTQIVAVFDTRAKAEALCRSADFAELDTDIEEREVQ